MPSRKGIAFYRKCCTQRFTQKMLAQALGVHVNTIYLWEKDLAEGGIIPPHGYLLKLAHLFVDQGAISDYESAVRFWNDAGHERFPVPRELRLLFDSDTPIAPHPIATPERMPTGELPAHTTLPTGSRMPLRRNRLFVGRTDDLVALAAALKSGNSIVILTGLAGMGKTQLACEFAHRYGQFFPGGVFWISFANRDAVAAEIAACGGPGHLNLHQHFESLPLERQVQLVQAAWRDPVPRLLVFDNCEEEALLDQWQPETGGCRVLVTSRRPRWSPTQVDQMLPLRVLDRPESIALLRGHCAHLPGGAGTFFSAPDVVADLDAIADELGDLPLALHLAGAYLAHRYPDLTPARYLAQLRDSTNERTNLILQHPSLQAEGISPTRHQQHIVAALSLSFGRLRRTNPSDVLALKLLAHAAYFAPGEPIPRVLLLAAVDPADSSPDAPAQVEDALARLVSDLGLLELGERCTLRMHRLVGGFVRAVSNDEGAQAAVERVLLAEGRRLNETSVLAAPLVLQHLRAVTEAARARRDERAADLCDTLGWQLYLVRDLTGAQSSIEQAMTIRAALPEADHAATFESLEMLALAYQIRDKIPLAGQLFKQILAFRESVLGPDHSATADTYNNLGCFLMFQGGDYTRARYYLEQAVRVRRRVYGLKHGMTARSIRNLGYTHFRLGHYRVARRYLLLALRIYDLDPATFQIAKAQTLRHLGELSFELNDYNAAWHYHEQALKIREAVLRPGDNDIAESLWRLGRICHALGQYGEAKSYLERALAMNEALFDDNHSEIARILDSIGALLLTLGDFIGARSYLERALASWRGSFGERHPDTAITLVNLGLLAQAEGKRSAALVHFEQVLSIREAMLGLQHPCTLDTRRQLDALKSNE